MEAHLHTMNNLFAQLGLPSGNVEIERFIAAHRPLDGKVVLHCAPFWTPSQSAFLHEKIVEDADWSSVIDEFNSRLA